jgi:rhodanese-related sulfurtransferase
MACCCVGTDTIQKALAISCIAMVLGAAHSAFRPIVEKVDTKALQGTNLDDLRAKRAAEASKSGNGARPAEGAKPADGAKPVEAPAADAGTPANGTLGFEITIAQGFSLFELGVPFVDARSVDDFEKGHVAGAIRMSADEYPSRAGELASFFPGPVVIYCGGGQCDASHNLAKLMQQAKFTALHVMTDGYPGWEKAGHPIEKGGK